jgi:hypothetical protein
MVARENSGDGEDDGELEDRERCTAAGKVSELSNFIPDF